MAGVALLVTGCAHVGAASDHPRTPTLAGTHWTIASINDAAPAAERETAMRFTADRVSGNAGCNSFGGGYSFVGGVMTMTQLISTKMACPGPGMGQESAVFKILQRPLTVTAEEDGSLTLSSEAGTIRLTPDNNPSSP